MASTLTNELKPITDVTLTIRIIKSFKFRNFKSLVLHHLNELTLDGLLEICLKEMKEQTGWKAFQNLKLDTFKLYTKAHGSKTTNLIINLDQDELIFTDHTIHLSELGLENETELSLFNRLEYDEFKSNPEQSW
ncbi:uncharacterized protein MELLADRAFT_46599 [Melampsora larici-populina 98AG31]|uniref:Cytoplasmic protein n=1 Tax=Melampsora larici-populina (strain 98AG31 / pathotype 3-4-7) TaxID=747676 RepID=F4R4Z5_MELLP|nr:uncharacterized protein MELLADRAFT_46599 [Melampsora larici-populina 98AG31]EGG11966.1 hypothetical protein MELLADRAFT_46599 [Melampsora larici-populina 98AG31]